MNFEFNEAAGAGYDATDASGIDPVFRNFTPSELPSLDDENVSELFSLSRDSLSRLLPEGHTFESLSLVFDQVANGQLPSAINDPIYLFRAQYTKERIERELNALIGSENSIGRVQVLENGSMACGHFTGPKPVEHSANYQNLTFLYPEVESVVEVDLRIIVEPDIDIGARNILDIVALVLRPHEVRNCVTTNMIRWDVELSMTSVYLYEHIGNGTVVEYEVCLNQAPYLEIAEFWDKVFTDEEIAWQTETRELLRALKAPYEDMFCRVKKQQCQEARWRVASYYAMKRLGHDLPFSHFFESRVDGEFAPKQIEWLVQHWMDGETGISDATSILDRPSTQFVAGSDKLLKSAAILANELHTSRVGEKIMSYFLEAPKPPYWVDAASSLQNLLISKAKRT